MPWQRLTGRYRLFALLLFVFLVSTTLTLLTDDLWVTIIVSAALCLVLWITRPVWLPSSYGTTRLRMLSLWTIMGLVVTYGTWQRYVQLARLVDYLPDSMHEPASALLAAFALDQASVASVVLVAFAILAIVALNFAWRDRTAMGSHERAVAKDFPERDYRDRLMDFGRVLEIHLRALDLESNWSPVYYTELDAEVEKHAFGRSRRIKNLHRSIRGDLDSKLFLVLGDPGSGKSVALRKLALDLLSEIDATGKVPIYVNLKEWRHESRWMKENPPTSVALLEFIRKNLDRRLDKFGREFVSGYFDRLLQTGRLFLILDSFDEIPDLLEVDESSWLIASLSHAIETLLSGSGSRGVLASRLFRRPSTVMMATTLLEIRPFTEEQIAMALQKALTFPAKVLKQLFSERAHLVPYARNPFFASLIRSYAGRHNGELPQTQTELFENYVSDLVDSELPMAAQSDEAICTVIDQATEIAYAMFEDQRYGLELRIDDLKEAVRTQRESREESVDHKAKACGEPRPDEDVRKDDREKAFDVEEAVARLRDIRLARGRFPNDPFSFVHRRFHEYFVARMLTRDRDLVPMDEVGRDSRWRDALVLYAETSSVEEAMEIANRCWARIDTNELLGEVPTQADYTRAVVSLRFLADAFSGRQECVSGFESELTDLIGKTLEPGGNVLTAKIAVESTGVLPPETSEPLLVRAFALKNSWINETAFRACRRHPRISHQLERKLKARIGSMSVTALLRQSRELLLSLRLSEAFGGVRWHLVLALVDIGLLGIAYFLLGLLAWPVFLVLGMWAAWDSAYNASSSPWRATGERHPVIRLYVAVSATRRARMMRSSCGHIQREGMMIGCHLWV